MKYITVKMTLLLLLCCQSQFFFAQNSAKIKSTKINGRVIDDKGALEFVEVAVKQESDSTKVIGYSTTASNGTFTIENIVNGNYILQFRLIGYKSLSKNIIISDVNPTISLNDIILKNEAAVLNTVMVSSQKKIIKKTSEGFVFNNAANIAQVGGTATDVLKNIPTVSVDADGAVTLRGKMPMILINGKNSAITNINQIPASSIESVEIVNNPTAKYDANAESGIINIKLKKNSEKGINGAVAIGAGFGAKGRINNSVLLNHKKGKWNFGLGYDNRFAGRKKKISGSRTNYFITDEHLLSQNRNDKRFEQLQNLNFNVDFSPNEKNNFSLELTGNTEGQDNDETLKTLINTDTKAFYSNNQRHSLEIERSKVAEIAFNFERTFDDERKNLSASISSSYENNKQNTDIDTYNYDVSNNQLGDVDLERTHDYEKENVSNAKVDYAFPISQKSIIETGYKGTFRFFDADFQAANNVNGVYVVNTNSSNVFKFNEQINAVYGLLNSFIGDKENQKWKYNLGIRIEQVSNAGKTLSASNDFNNNYIKLFPSASLQYNLKSDSSLKLGYSKRINRPELGQLNPFLDITDALNPHSGNPFLKPEIINSIELGYTKDWKNYSLSSNVFYRNATNTIKQYAELQSDGVVLISPKNFGKTVTYGWESILNLKPLEFYNATLSFTAFQQNIDGSNVGENVASKAFNWYGKIINNFVPWQKGKLQLIGNYNSKLATAQGNRIAIYSVDMGFQQKLGNGNARLGFVVTDMFNTLKSGYQNNTATFSNNRVSKSDTRAIMVTFAYAFKSAFKEKLMDNQFKSEY